MLHESRQTTGGISLLADMENVAKDIITLVLCRKVLNETYVKTAILQKVCNLVMVCSYALIWLVHKFQQPCRRPIYLERWIKHIEIEIYVECHESASTELFNTNFMKKISKIPRCIYYGFSWRDLYYGLIERA